MDSMETARCSLDKGSMSQELGVTFMRIFTFRPAIVWALHSLREHFAHLFSVLTSEFRSDSEFPAAERKVFFLFA